MMEVRSKKFLLPPSSGLVLDCRADVGHHVRSDDGHVVFLPRVFFRLREYFVLVLSNNYLVAAGHHITAPEHFGHLRTSLAAEWSSVGAGRAAVNLSRERIR